MNAMLKKSLTLSLIALLTTGCQWNNRDTGTAVGAVAGGLAGNALTGGSTAGTLVGAVGGGFVGNQLAK